MAQLVQWKYTGRGVLTYDPMEGINQAIDNLINAAFSRKPSITSNRPTLRNGRYMYVPSSDYVNAKKKLLDEQQRIKERLIRVR